MLQYCLNDFARYTGLNRQPLETVFVKRCLLYSCLFSMYYQHTIPTIVLLSVRTTDCYAYVS